jgi:hypothetical protein
LKREGGVSDVGGGELDMFAGRKHLWNQRRLDERG